MKHFLITDSSLVASNGHKGRMLTDNLDDTINVTSRKHATKLCAMRPVAHSLTTLETKSEPSNNFGLASVLGKGHGGHNIVAATHPSSVQ